MMSGDGSPSNIFDEAGKKKGVKKGEAQTPPLPKLNRQELEELIKEVYSQHDKFERQLDELYQKSGFSPKTINQFLENPQNLTEAQRKVLEERKNRLKRQLSPKKGQQYKEIKQKGKTEEETLKRKGKTLGGRKGWISM